MRRLFACLVVAGAVVAAPVEAKPAPKIRQLVVFQDGSAFAKRVSTRATHVTVHGERCAVARRTALAALIRSDPGTLKLRDFGACSDRARDGAGLFVRQIRSDRNKGQDGWVYKVGRKAATSGAADPSGAFGTGRRLRSGQRVTWFFCHLTGTSCQRTLALRTKVEPGAVTVKVTGYDDAGEGIVISGATVISGAVTGTTGGDGRVRLPLPAGKRRIRAEKAGLIRSFTEKVTIP